MLFVHQHGVRDPDRSSASPVAARLRSNAVEIGLRPVQGEREGCSPKRMALAEVSLSIESRWGKSDG